MLAPEGKRVLIPLLILTFAVGYFGYKLDHSALKIAYGIIGFLFVFSLFFFRDPQRPFPKDENTIFSPADGKVVQIKDVNDPDVGNDVVQVSIFLSVFNVHVNRVPVSGTVNCYADPGTAMAQGDRLGYIMFGSRTDIIFPKTAALNVEVGTVVKGGMSTIGTFS